MCIFGEHSFREIESDEFSLRLSLTDPASLVWIQGQTAGSNGVTLFYIICESAGGELAFSVKSAEHRDSQ